MNRLKKTATILPFLLMAVMPCYADGLKGLEYVFYAVLIMAGINLLSIIFCIAFYRRMKQGRVPTSLKLVNWLLLAVNIFVAAVTQRLDFGGSIILWLVPLVQVSLIITDILSKPLTHRAYMLIYSLRTFAIAYLISKLAWELMFYINWMAPSIIVFQLPLAIVLLYYAYAIYKYLEVVRLRYPEHFNRKYCITYALGFINTCMLISIYLIPLIWRLIVELFNISGSMIMIGYNPIYFICVFGVSNLVAYFVGVNAYKRLSEKN